MINIARAAFGRSTSDANRLASPLPIESEAERDLSWGVEVGLQHGAIEDAEGAHNHFMMLVDGGLRDQRFKLVVAENPFNFHSEIRQGWEEVVLLTAGLDVMRVGE